ncbi:Uncharacterized protein OBRU01_26700 [Operophtera brumata]|uniref:Uncharacterized protein n=1 Tax=Operophtera brumata TaxID=104452 RepID=A0A0L7K2S7_OPEBR|nr:Uncharacterized protein OBRU01_26700 [Operophtera brumata]
MLAYYYQTKTDRRKNEAEFTNYYVNLLGSTSTAYQDLFSRCRVCLQRLKEGYISIYSGGNTEEIVEALQVFGNIAVREDDHTKLLCSICTKFIKQAISFRKIAMRSDEIIRKPVEEKVIVKVEAGNKFEDDHDSSEICLVKRPVLHFKNQELSSSVVKQKTKPKTTCHICNKVMYLVSLKQHLLVHDPYTKKYVCDLCGKAFKYYNTYKQHRQSHRKTFPFKCKFCPYRAQNDHLLKSHSRTHTRDYRYVCKECNAKFLYVSNLNVHKLKHKEPQFKCDACKKAFYTKLKRQRHYEGQHLGIKNHVCNICDSAFATRRSMMGHQRGVHKREKLPPGRMPSYIKAKNMDKEELNFQD